MVEMWMMHTLLQDQHTELDFDSFTTNLKKAWSDH